MTDEKIRAVLTRYEQELTRRGFVAERAAQFPGAYAPLAHCLWMISETRVFLQEQRREKVMRWLGFIQGVLWDEGVYSIEEMKEHNRPDSDA